MTLRLAHVLLLIYLPLTGGCAEEPTAAQPKTKGAAGAASKAGSKAVATGDKRTPPPVEFQDSDFVESERSRDPFRSFAKFFVDKRGDGPQSQREVVLKDYSIDQLKLVGIVTNIRPPRAMLVDPTGRGHVISRGQFIGKAEIVAGAANTGDYEINWRVERIRPDDIVLVREDPSNPDVPTATRVIPLRPDEPVAIR
jgi:type IV pilus assembly protein PilP